MKTALATHSGSYVIAWPDSSDFSDQISAWATRFYLQEADAEAKNEILVLPYKDTPPTEKEFRSIFSYWSASAFNTLRNSIRIYCYPDSTEPLDLKAEFEDWYEDQNSVNVEPRTNLFAEERTEWWLKIRLTRLGRHRVENSIGATQQTVFSEEDAKLLRDYSVEIYGSKARGPFTVKRLVETHRALRKTNCKLLYEKQDAKKNGQDDQYVKVSDLKAMTVTELLKLFSS